MPIRLSGKTDSTRGVMHTRQQGLLSVDTFAVNSLSEGQIVINQERGRQPALVLKKNSRLYKSYLSADGNHYVDKKLSAGELDYRHKFTDYRTFIHNYEKNTDGAETFVPWNGTGDQTSMDAATSGFLVPFDMTCYKILFRAEPLDSMTYDITFKIYKQDDDQNADEVANYTYDVSEYGFSDDTAITIKRTDFNNNPKVDAGDKVGLSIDFATDPGNDTVDFYVTSVWRVEVVL